MTEPTHLGYGRIGQAVFVVVPAVIGARLGWGLLAARPAARAAAYGGARSFLDGKHVLVTHGSPSGPAPPGRRADRRADRAVES